VELSESMSGIGPGAQKGLEIERFRSKMRQDIKGVSRHGIREVRDNSKALPYVRSLIGGCIDRRRSVRKSGGRVRM
jgi:hypothetical protein